MSYELINVRADTLDLFEKFLELFASRHELNAGEDLYRSLVVVLRVELFLIALHEEPEQLLAVAITDIRAVIIKILRDLFQTAVSKNVAVCMPLVSRESAANSTMPVVRILEFARGSTVLAPAQRIRTIHNLLPLLPVKNEARDPDADQGESDHSVSGEITLPALFRNHRLTLPYRKRQPRR